ncbi:MAG: PaaI family thioesterase [Chloroflexi bacterium]|nr:PaaI family thioesterase [Chloroflexota bacterium]
MKNSASLQELASHGPCFVCGTENPHSIGVTWYIRDDEAIVSEVIFTEAQQGPPGYVHGGASAAVLDEAMGAAVWRAGFTAVAVNLNIDYRRPIPLHQPVFVEAHLTDREGRAIPARGEIRLADGTVAVVARGIFVEAPQLFTRSDFLGKATSDDEAGT